MQLQVSCPSNHSSVLSRRIKVSWQEQTPVIQRLKNDRGAMGFLTIEHFVWGG
jgi:hypothetical protein